MVRQALFPILRFGIRYIEHSEILEHTFSSWRTTCSPDSESNVGAGGKIFTLRLNSITPYELPFISVFWNKKFELSFVFLSMIQTLLKQLKVSAPIGFLKSNPDTVISLTQRSYSEVGRRLTRLLSVLQDSKQASNSSLSM